MAAPSPFLYKAKMSIPDRLPSVASEFLQLSDKKATNFAPLTIFNGNYLHSNIEESRNQRMLNASFSRSPRKIYPRSPCVSPRR